VIDINQVIGSVISGCATSCGAFLVVAGASKLYRSIRSLEEMTAIRRALRMPRRQWRLFGLAAGGVECLTGLLVCSGASPVLGGVGMAGLGAVFCVLLAYVLVRQIPRGDWFGGGVLASVTVLVLLSMRMPVRTPVCRRPLWHRARTTLRALTSHEMFAAMAASAGPFEPVARYRRTGCTDEFWFTAATEQDSDAVVFRVRQAVSGARLAVHASLRDTRTPGTSWPARAITVAAGQRRETQ